MNASDSHIPSDRRPDDLDDGKSLEARAAELTARGLEWNEIDFVPWKEFRRMAPSIVGLEIARIEAIMQRQEVGSDAYNSLVTVRFCLRSFIDELKTAAPADIEKDCRPTLQSALVTASLLAEKTSDVDADRLRYTANRLRYILERIHYIY